MSLGTSAIHARSQTNNKNIDICENTLLLKRVYCGMFNIFLPADDEVTIIIKNVSGTGHLCVSLRFRFVYLVATVRHGWRKNYRSCPTCNFVNFNTIGSWVWRK